MDNKEHKLGLIAPSSIISYDTFRSGIKILEDKGLDVFVHPQYEETEHSSAGTPDQKADALHDLFSDPSINTIMAARGGNRASHILDKLDYDLIKQHPKLYIGFSDSTALSCALYKKAGLNSLWGPVVQSLPSLTKAAKDHFFDLIQKKPTQYPLEQAEILTKGKASGPLLGGSLSILCAQIGTDYLPNFEGAILFVEDVGEELNRIDRMLLQLKRALPFEALSGILFGQFTQIKDTGTPFGYSLKDIICEHTQDLNIPIVMNAPFGHIDNFHALPFGSISTLDTGHTEPILETSL
jgi:muramoyltetrapeptide carboxypeptidase